MKTCWCFIWCFIGYQESSKLIHLTQMVVMYWLLTAWIVNEFEIGKKISINIYIPWEDCAAAPSPSVPWTCCDSNCDMTSASNESSSAAKPFWDAAASEQIESWNEASSWGDNASRPSFPIWLCLRIKLVQTSEKLLCLKTIQLPSWEMCVTITLYSQTWGCKGTHWWEHSPSTNVALVRILTPTPYVGWVCRWFSPLLQEVFLRSGTPKCFVGKQITI